MEKFELADRLVNRDGYANDHDESDRRAGKRDDLMSDRCGGGGIIIGEVEEYRMRGGGMTTQGYKPCPGCIDCDYSSCGEYPPCPRCGEPIDYCPGHGEIVG